MTAPPADRCSRAGDIDAQVGFFSADWPSGSGMTKGELREHLEQQAGEGGARDQTLALDDAAVVVDEGRASVDPVGYRSPTGGSFLEFRMVRETDGAWRCQAVNGSSLADSATTSR